MKTQRNIIYITIICSVISALLYAFCVFDWNPSKCSGGYNWNTYISNLILGVWGSSIISFIVGVVSYNECRRKDMEAFIFSQSDLFVHCMRFKKENSIEWFDEYAKLYRDLSNNWSNIWFLFDPVRQRLFLKEYIDYYGDFIELTQDKYNLLRQTDSVESQKKILDEINEINKRYHEIHRDIARCEEIKKQDMYEVFEKVINEEENNQYEEQEDEYELEI